MDGPRRSDRKRTQPQFTGATETLGRQVRDQPAERRAREAAIASAYEPLVGLVQLGEVGGEGRVWVGAEDSPALGGFAPTPADRQRFRARAAAIAAAYEPLGGLVQLRTPLASAALDPICHAIAAIMPSQACVLVLSVDAAASSFRLGGVWRQPASFAFRSACRARARRLPCAATCRSTCNPACALSSG
jgi:hypothetical protein